MCYMNEVSNLDMDWENFSIVRRENSVAELHGRKREMTILHQNDTLAASICKPDLHEYTLQNRSVTYNLLETMKFNPLDTKGSVQADIELKWGGPDGTKWSGGVSGEARDDHGNYAKVELKKDANGENTARVSAGYEPKYKNDNEE